MNVTTYSSASVAARGARRALKNDKATPGKDFAVKPTADGRFMIELLAAEAKKPTAKKAAAKPAPKKATRAKAADATLTALREVATGASKIESPCAVVFDLADNMKGARRRDVIAAAVAKGVSYYTARTQYQHWYNASKADAARAAKK